MQKLVLIRGIPGSGKSTLAKIIVGENSNYDHYEADMYFIIDGKYNFIPSKIKNAHQWCQFETETALRCHRSVVVSNTFTKLWEMQPYFELAKRYDVEIEVIECKGNYQNIHGVPDTVIQKMKSRWENYISS